MYRDNDLLNGWVGGPILVRYLAGEEHSVETITEQIVANPSTILISDLEVHLSAVYLEQYDALGINVRQINKDKELEGAGFLPWSAILTITGSGELEEA